MTSQNGHPSPVPSIAYFSMEIGLDARIPTYSGGLGVLAGDSLRAAADLGIPMVAVTLLHRKGYFTQHLDERGQQSESPTSWQPEEFLELLPMKTSIEIAGRRLHLRAWRYIVTSTASGCSVPVYLLDTQLPENAEPDQAITDYLYGGDSRYRLRQEAVLGLGGVAMLRRLGHMDIKTFHMNEGHSSLLTLALLRERMGSFNQRPSYADQVAVRNLCVFTTHTPVPAGHDQFPLDLAERELGRSYVDLVEATGCCPDKTLNMTYLGFFFSRYINAVSMRHQSVSQDMYPQYNIHSITNGVHVGTWTSEPFKRLFDRYIPGWRRDNSYLRQVVGIPLKDIMATHARAKQDLLNEVARRTGRKLDPNAFTIGFARRSTAYKRGDLLFSDLERLARLRNRVGPVQVIYAGKAHPHDGPGKALIRRIHEASETLRETIPVVYLEGYDMQLGGLLTSGVDLWLNTPQKPLEASGTSGMKAAVNGVPSLSVLDGWWIEGHVEGVTGWAIGNDAKEPGDQREEIESLYSKLEREALPLFYSHPEAYAEAMRSTIAINGSYFTAQRMALQYLVNAYRIPSLYPMSTPMASAASAHGMS